MQALVVAGGRSSRFGRDKRLVDVRGSTLLQRTIETLRPVATALYAATDKSGVLPMIEDVSIVRDRRPGHGPWVAVADFIEHVQENVLVVASDLPRLTTAYLQRLADEVDPEFDAVVSRVGEQWEPLAAVYGPSFLPALRRVAEAGLSLQGELDTSSRVKSLRPHDASLLFNWNVKTPAGVTT